MIDIITNIDRYVTSVMRLFNNGNGNTALPFLLFIMIAFIYSEVSSITITWIVQSVKTFKTKINKSCKYAK